MLGYTRRHLFIALAAILCISSISWVAVTEKILGISGVNSETATVLEPR
jgi:hypothetical protein